MSYPVIESGMLEEWQEITNLVASLCHVPAALVMRKNQQSMEVMSASQHPDSPYKAFETAPLNGELYCETVIKTQTPLHVPNALNDPDWDHHSEGMTSYYGVPVNWPDGGPFGTICILDRVEKSTTDEEKEIVKRFARIIEVTLELIASNHELEKFQTLTESINDWAWEVDANGVYTYTSPQVKEMLGYEPDELLGKTPFDLMVVKDKEHIGELFKNIVRSGKPFSGIENINLHKDGHEVILESSGNPIFDGRGELTGYRGIDRDISERKRIEEELYSTLRFQSEIAQNIAEGISLVRAEDGLIVYANEKFEQMFGYEPGELDGKHVTTLNAPGDKIVEDISEEIVKTLIKEGQWDGEVNNIRKDGSIFWSYAAVSVFQHPEYGTVWLGAQRDISEKKQAEEMLLESKTRSETLLSAITDAVFVHGISEDGSPGKFIELNDVACHQLGYTREELLDLSPLDVDAPDSGVDMELLARRLSAGENVSFEQIHISKNGKRIPVEIHAQVFTLKGKPTVMSLVRDISDYKRLEDELTQSRDFYLRLFEGFPALIWRAGTDAKCNYFNSSWLEFTGRSMEQEMGDGWAEGVHPDDLDHCLAIYLGAFAKREAFKMEYRLRHWDGNYRWLMDFGRPYNDLSGNFAGYIGSCFDLSDHKRVEEALELTQIRHDEAQRIAQLGHWTLDLISNELIWSDENCRLFGVAPGSVNTYETFMGAVHPDDRTFVDHSYTESLKNRTPYEIEHRVLMKDGSITWVNERCETEYADDGSPLRSIGTTLDITERRQLKDTLYFTAQRGWDANGEDFFKALATHLAKTLQIDFVIIGKQIDSKRVKTIALYAKGATRKNIEYLLRHTPCENVVGGDICYYPQGIQQLFPLDEMLIEMGAESYLAIPLWDSRGEPLGLIALLDSKPMNHESRAKELLQIVAVRVAAELERRDSDEALDHSRKQLRALIEHIRAVREKEQKRIARDIHDVLGQILTAININISSIEEMLPEEQKAIRAKAQEVSALVSTAISKVQKISSTLRPTLLDDLGITAAVEWQTNEFQNRTGIHSRFAATPSKIIISDNLATEIYRIFQEALTNVARHAEATEVVVSLSEYNGRVILEVRDNGRGITEKEINDFRSIGLIGIRERAYSLHGDVEIQGKPGKGSIVIVNFPTGDKE